MKPLHLTVLITLFICGLLSCEKWKDANPDVDPRITERRYCNDPEAMNYNWDFPGLPDSTLCIYPADNFQGTYSFTDSIYFSDNTLDTNRIFQNYILQLTPTAKNKLLLSGFCTGNNLMFTAERISNNAYADTTLKINDSTYAYGQFFCRMQDTLTGTISKPKDSLPERIYIEWTVVSDSGVNYHKGTAIKQ